MKKFILILAAVTLLFSAALAEEELSAPDRNVPEQTESGSLPERAASVPSLEEYSRQAWPLTQTAYADLLNNPDAQYGQVYMVKGVMIQLLSKDPVRVIVCADGDGKTMPVMVECPETAGFTWKPGTSCLIYAEVADFCRGLPVLTARYMFFNDEAEDLSGLTDEQLSALYQKVRAEMARRDSAFGKETDFDTAVRECVTSFFVSWSYNNLDRMLDMCDPEWKASVDNPKTELFRLHLNRIPVDMEIESVGRIAGEIPYALVTVVSRMDRVNEKPATKYRYRILVREAEDGRWYIVPTCLTESEEAESADTVLYYNPTGAEYYHLDPNCRRVHATFLPLQGSFSYAELNQEPYRDLKPCEICGAPPAPAAEK